jgi:large subunit ribosomal protein L3
MLNTILGSKKETGQTFVEGFRIPVTKVLAGPCVVTHIKNMDKDGYWAIQIGFSTRRAKNTSKPLQGHLGKTSKENNFPRYLREIRTDKEPEVKVGEVLLASDIFKVGDVVAVTGTSKGKGFAGGVKRWHFHGGPRTHGQSDRERAPGSIGGTTTPGRVYKGKKMAGRMGGETVTVKNLHVISINPDTNELEISGMVPGIPGSLISIYKIKSGSLDELKTETVAQVVEGEEEAPKEEGVTQEAPTSEVKEEPKNVEESN